MILPVGSTQIITISAIFPTDDGGVYVCGSGVYTCINGEPFVFVVKYTDDGEAVLIVEQYFKDTQRVTGNFDSPSYEKFFNYRDILLVNISSLGKIEWVEKIPKRQLVGTPAVYYISYEMKVHKDNRFFIFNHNMDNAGYTGEGEPKRFGGYIQSHLMLVALDGNGKQTRELLVSGIDAKFMVRPSHSMALTKDELIIYGRTRNRYRLSKLSFQ
ncbi:MAG: hypothetical protein ACI8XB_001425 [Patiriisocius sp.]